MKKPESRKSFHSHVWYAIQTLHCKEERLGEYLKKKNLHYFIPMCYQEKVNPNGKKQRVLTPAIHNLVFIKKTFDEQEIQKIASESPVPFIPIRHSDTKKYYEIPDTQMVELRALCDPSYTGTIFVEAEIAEARPGSRVCVIHGPFTGLEGKLTRYKNKYYVVIILATLGVMVHIPKWYCKKIE